ncbi:hypothetical protein DPM19_30690 [Actinomadura craniellae]|uniref:Asl1-like glycosyl hydrolase catalytic domain-containing protein n=1 Tax=Actinomadura craniellae TaxID=2231787 RepID=A0A365GX41_9ACTN|nr:hypothetical protein [Actinomadura craniellae]RAY11394.1 hypothetical protein DPM19_30690 [Actinomadura craniellae]
MSGIARGAAVAAALALVAGCTGDPAPPPAPAPAVPPPTRLEQPFGLKWNSYRPIDRYAPAVGAYRGGGTFHDITWCAVEPAPGTFRWTMEDRAVDTALGQGYELLLRIRIGSCWASGRPAAAAARTAPSHPPADLTAYRAFVRTLVGRYARRGVHRYAIENEVDTATHWGADPRAYAAVARAGAAAVREADPRARVTDPGLASSGHGLAAAAALQDSGRQDRAVALYRAYYARRVNDRLPPVRDAAGLRAARAGTAGHRILTAHETVLGLGRAKIFDSFQLHYYDPWRQAGDVLAYLRARLPANLPVEAWEAGSFWPGGSYDPARHAAETAQLATTLLAAGVRLVVYLPLVHTPGTIAPTERWRGLYGTDGTARPASAVLDALRERTRGGTWHPVARAGLRGAAVDRGGTTALVLWSADGRTRPLRRPPGPAESTPLPGAARPWTAGDVQVGGTPVLLSLRAPLNAALTWLDQTAP